MIYDEFEEEELEPPLRQDRDEAEGDEAEVVGCRVTRSDELPKPKEGSPVPAAERRR